MNCEMHKIKAKSIAANMLDTQIELLPIYIVDALDSICVLCDNAYGELKSRQVIATIVYDAIEREKLNQRIDDLMRKLNI